MKSFTSNKFQFTALEHYPDCFAVTFKEYPLGVIKLMDNGMWYEPRGDQWYGEAHHAASVLKTRFYKMMQNTKEVA